MFEVLLLAASLSYSSVGESAPPAQMEAKVVVVPATFSPDGIGDWPLGGIGDWPL